MWKYYTQLTPTSFHYSTKDATYSEEEGAVKMYLRGRPITLYAPTSLVEGAGYSMEKVSPAPTQKLKLEWVYGYRGRDAR